MAAPTAAVVAAPSRSARTASPGPRSRSASSCGRSGSVWQVDRRPARHRRRPRASRTRSGSRLPVRLRHASPARPPLAAPRDAPTLALDTAARRARHRRARHRRRPAAGSLANVSGSSSLAQVVNLAYPLADCARALDRVIGAAVAGRRPAAVLAAGAALLGDACGRSPPRTWQPVMAPTRSTRCGRRRRRRLAAERAAPPVPRPRTTPPRSSPRVDPAARANEWLAVPPLVVLAALALTPSPHGGARGARASAPRDASSSTCAALERELDLHFQPLVDVAPARPGAEALLRWPRRAFVRPTLPARRRAHRADPPADRLRARPRARRRRRWRPPATRSASRQPRHREPLRGRPARPRPARAAPPRPPAARAHARDHRDRRDRRQRDRRPRARARSTSSASGSPSTTSAPAIPRSSGSPASRSASSRSTARSCSEMHTAERPIVATSIQLAHALGLRVVAEGVEDEADARRAARARLRPRPGLLRLASAARGRLRRLAAHPGIRLTFLSPG